VAAEKNRSPERSAVEMVLRLLALAARTAPNPFCYGLSGDPDCSRRSDWRYLSRISFKPRSRTLHDAFTRFWVDRAGRIREEEVL
jgi:hypothetical protein